MPTPAEDNHDNPKIVFRNPNFRVHKSLLRFALPLSKFAKLPSNNGKTLVVGVIVLHPETFAPGQQARLMMLEKADAENRLELPSGRAVFGTDQTLLEAVARIARETTGLRVTDIVKSIQGEEWSDRVEAQIEHFKRYSFFVKADAVGSHADLRDAVELGREYRAWEWMSREDVHLMEGREKSGMAEEVKQTVEKAFDFVDAAVSPRCACPRE